MSKVVRSSKFRHVFVTISKKTYEDVAITRTAWDSNLVCANGSFFGVILEASGGGAFSVLPYSLTGKAAGIAPKITGHKGPVLDIEFNPFNDSLIASASEDCYVKIWGIPEGGLKANMTDPLQVLSGHKRKVGSVSFHPLANNTLMTTSTDFTVKSLGY